MRTAPVSPTEPCLISVNLPEINLLVTQHISNMYALYIHTTHTHLSYTHARSTHIFNNTISNINRLAHINLLIIHTHTTNVYTLPNKYYKCMYSTYWRGGGVRGEVGGWGRVLFSRI